MRKSVTVELADIDQLYLAVHEHQYGATLYLFRWESEDAPLGDEDDAAWLAQQLKIDFEPDRDEHLTCFPFGEINNLNNIATVLPRPSEPEDEP